MNAPLVIGAVLAAALAIYLFAALLSPERLS